MWNEHYLFKAYNAGCRLLKVVKPGFQVNLPHVDEGLEKDDIVII